MGRLLLKPESYKFFITTEQTQLTTNKSKELSSLRSSAGGPAFSPSRRLYEPEATIPLFLPRETFFLFHWGHFRGKFKSPKIYILSVGCIYSETFKYLPHPSNFYPFKSDTCYQQDKTRAQPDRDACSAKKKVKILAVCTDTNNQSRPRIRVCG